MTIDTQDTIRPDLAGALVRSALADVGVPETDAQCVADALVETSLRGIDTHGLRLVAQYLDELATGVAKAEPRISVVQDRGAALQLDADGALGIIGGTAAVRYAAERARKFGMAAVGVRNSNHFGAASVYSRALAHRGLIGVAVTSAASRVAPYGGVEALFGTNPISVAAGGADQEFSLDMATSQVCFGEIKQRRAEGRPLGPGWATDASGAATDDPTRAHALSPLGGYKGQGLAMAVTLLAAVLTGSPLDWQLDQVGQGKTGAGRRIGHLVMALDPTAFAGAEAFRSGLEELLGTVRSAARSGDESVVAPGDPQRRNQRDRLENGIPLDTRTAAFFTDLMGRHPQVACDTPVITGQVVSP